MSSDFIQKESLINGDLNLLKATSYSFLFPLIYIRLDCKAKWKQVFLSGLLGALS